MPPQTHPSTLAIHADNRLNTLTDVAPPIHTATTFRYPRNPDLLQPVPADGAEFLDLSTPLVYSRLTNANVNRLEVVLAGSIFTNKGAARRDDEGEGEEVEDTDELANHVVTYSSGLSAFHALLVRLVPGVVAISGGYHGCHGVIDLHKRMHNLQTVDLHANEAAWDSARIGPGSLIHLETPLNPTGLAFPISHYAARAHARGALLSIDSTFAPPGLQDPFAHGADIVMHSGTKYIGGHSDMLCGVLAVRRGAWGAKFAKGLREDRIFLGSVMGSLEGWLGVRSLRTMELRVRRQSESAGRLVGWLDAALRSGEGESKAIKEVVERVSHASLQARDPANAWLKEQMPNGYGPVFAIYMRTPAQARSVPSHLEFFHHATSLGGVESLIEWRRMSDADVDERLLRVSVGIENWEDLRDDLLRAFRAVGKAGGEKNGVGKGGNKEGKKGVQVGQDGAEMPQVGSGAV